MNRKRSSRSVPCYLCGVPVAEEIVASGLVLSHISVEVNIDFTSLSCSRAVYHI